MGIDCKIYLAPASRVSDVVIVMAALAGLPVVRETIGTGENNFDVARCHYAEVTSVTSIPECCYLTLKEPNGKDINRKYNVDSTYRQMYHFEGGDNGERLIMPRSTAFSIAIGEGLVNFFGGHLFYTDCGDMEIADFSRPFRDDIRAEESPIYDLFQERILAVEPITAAQFLAAKQHAAY